LEKRFGDKNKPLSIEEIRTESSLRFKRLNMKSTKNDENEELEEDKRSEMSQATKIIGAR
jgi:hypothetical protein